MDKIWIKYPYFLLLEGHEMGAKVDFLVFDLQLYANIISVGMDGAHGKA